VVEKLNQKSKLTIGEVSFILKQTVVSVYSLTKRQQCEADIIIIWHYELYISKYFSVNIIGNEFLMFECMKKQTEIG